MKKHDNIFRCSDLLVQPGDCAFSVNQLQLQMVGFQILLFQQQVKPWIAEMLGFIIHLNVS